MLASLRVAPVPLRAFDPPCAPGEIDHRSAPRNGPFSLTKEWSIDHDRRALAAAKATTLGSIWLRQCPSVSGAFLGEATRSAIRAVAPELGLSWQKTRPSHPKAKPEAKDAFVKGGCKASSTALPRSIRPSA